MNQQLAVEIFQAIKPELFWMAVYVCVAGFVALLVKNALEMLVAYRIFKTNDQLGRRTTVRVRGNVGTIIKYNWRWIEVLTEDGSELMMISMKRWQLESWSVILDGESRNRRKGDHK